MSDVAGKESAKRVEDRGSRIEDRGSRIENRAIMRKAILDLRSSILLEPEDESRRWLRRMRGRIGIERGQPEIGPLEYQTSVFQPQCKVVIDAKVGAAAINERRLSLAIGPE